MATLGGVQDIKGIANIIEIENLARFAVDDHNKRENSELEFKKVLSAKQQVVAGTIYYITMEVKDGDQLKVYEARVWEKPWLNFREVQEFKLIGDVPSDSKFDGERTPSDSKIDDGKTPSGSTT